MGAHCFIIRAQSINNESDNQGKDDGTERSEGQGTADSQKPPQLSEKNIGNKSWGIQVVGDQPSVMRARGEHWGTRLSGNGVVKHC